MRHWELRERPRGFVVVDDSGQSVSPGFRTPEAALDWFQRRAQARAPKLRPCMCCGKGFESDGPHNRLCSACGRRAAPPLPREKAG